jgi:exodeoxyribonuclease-3
MTVSPALEDLVTDPATSSATATFSIASWNVNGLRAVAKKGFLDWLRATQAEVVGVQEVRAPIEEIPEALRSPEGWHTRFAAAQRKGYSGVGLFARTQPERIDVGVGEPRFDAEGRVVMARFGKLLVVNGYFPNGNGKERDNSRVPFKLDFYRHLFGVLDESMKRGERIVVMGDFNTAHTELDLARPKQNEKTSGFLLEERQELSRWLDAGWIDSFRCFEKGPGHYSWWSQRQGARARNVGWRIDYMLVSPGAAAFLCGAGIERDVLGSDHCPITLTLDRRVLSV